MGPISLFSIATLIWGSTWLAITFQLGSVAAEASVVYRFALAALMLAAWCLATGRSLRFPAAQHAWFASQGALLFGLNYLCVYWAEQHIASGLVAVLFSLIVFLNLVGVRVFFGIPFNRRTVVGAALGVTGVTLLFWRELAGMHTDALRGILFGLAATVFASGGNLLAVRNQRRGIPLLPGVAWGMTYGTLTIASLPCRVRIGDRIRGVSHATRQDRCRARRLRRGRRAGCGLAALDGIRALRVDATGTRRRRTLYRGQRARSHAAANDRSCVNKKNPPLLWTGPGTGLPKHERING
jgi:hypothetical protein